MVLGLVVYFCVSLFYITSVISNLYSNYKVGSKPRRLVLIRHYLLIMHSFQDSLFNICIRGNLLNSSFFNYIFFNSHLNFGLGLICGVTSVVGDIADVVGIERMSTDDFHALMTKHQIYKDK